MCTAIGLLLVRQAGRQPDPDPSISCPNRQVIIIEGIYSMEGEMVRLKEIVELKKRYKVGPHGLAKLLPTAAAVCCKLTGQGGS